MPALIVFDFDDTLAMTIALMGSTFFTTLQQELLTDEFPSLKNLTEDAFRQLCIEMNNSFGHSIHGLAHKLGKDRTWANNLIRLINHTIYEKVGHEIVIDPAIGAKLRELKRRGHNLVILTHGHAEAFTNRALADANLQDVFPPQSVFDIIFLNGFTKLQRQAYETFLQGFASQTFSHRFMVEDSPENLREAKAQGFETILLGAKTKGNEDIYVDHRFPGIAETLDHLLTTLP